MYNIIICDDDRAFVDYIKGVIAKSGMDKGEILFSEYYSGEELVQGIRNRKRCDLLILDMQMEGLDGHETAARFREVFPKSILVFCSGVHMPTDESFKATPFRYLLKSYSEERMISEICAVVRQIKENQNVPCIVGNYYHNSVALVPDDILYIENTKHGSRIHVGREQIEYSFEHNLTTRQKLGELYEILHPFGFAYAHNSYIVNLRYVVKMCSDGEMKLKDGTILTISRSRLKEFRSSFAEWVSRKYME